jgi:hypothetical protein
MIFIRYLIYIPSSYDMPKEISIHRITSPNVLSISWQKKELILSEGLMEINGVRFAASWTYCSKYLEKEERTTRLLRMNVSLIYCRITLGVPYSFITTPMISRLIDFRIFMDCPRVAELQELLHQEEVGRRDKSSPSTCSEVPIPDNLLKFGTSFL